MRSDREKYLWPFFFAAAASKTPKTVKLNWTGVWPPLIVQCPLSNNHFISKKKILIKSQFLNDTKFRETHLRKRKLRHWFLIIFHSILLSQNQIANIDTNPNGGRKWILKNKYFVVIYDSSTVKCETIIVDNSGWRDGIQKTVWKQRKVENFFFFFKLRRLMTLIERNFFFLFLFYRHETMFVIQDDVTWSNHRTHR